MNILIVLMLIVGIVFAGYVNLKFCPFRLEFIHNVIVLEARPITIRANLDGKDLYPLRLTGHKNQITNK